MKTQDLFIVEYSDGEIDDSGDFGGFTVFLDRRSAEDMLDCVECADAAVVHFVREDRLAAVEQERDQLRAKAARLREALEKIADDGIERSRDPRTLIASAVLSSTPATAEWLAARDAERLREGRG
jgi:hypothetical protein